MKSEWKVTSQVIEGKRLYGVYRLLDTAEVDHSGNRELAGNYIDDRERAEFVANKLNEKE